MNFRLSITINHKSFNEPITREIYLAGRDLADVLDKLETLEHHKYNLGRFGRTAFKDARGVKHQWVIREIKK